MTINDIEKCIKSIVPNARIVKGIGQYHIATNALLISNTNIEQELIKLLNAFTIIENISIINKYLNIRFYSHILDVLTLDYNINHYNEIVNLEYSSPNPTGSMHLGHLRATLYGAALAELYKLCGYHITTDMYINNAGNQFKLFIESIKAHANNEDISQIEYKGEYVKEYAKILPKNFTSLDVVRMMVNEFQQTLNKFNIKHDRIPLETDQYDYTVEAINILQSKGFIRRGKLNNQIDSNNDKLIIQNIEEVNDFVVGHIRYNENTHTEEIIYTYAGYDIGYSYGKYKNGFKNQICCVGEDHLGHIAKMNAIMKYIDNNINLQVVYTGIVKFEANDQLIIMSKRQGTFITINSVLEKYHINALVQTVFSHTEHQKATINLSDINENVIYVLSYVYNKIKNNQTGSFYNDDELIRLVLFWPECVKQAFRNKSIHIIYTYAINLANYIYDNKLYQHKLHEEICNILSVICKILFIQ